MHKAIVTAALLVTTSTIAFAQQDRATDITAAQVQQVLKAPSKIVDHTLKVVDLGDYALSVAVIKRGPTRAAGAAAPPTPTATMPISTAPTSHAAVAFQLHPAHPPLAPSRMTTANSVTAAATSSSSIAASGNRYRAKT